MKQPKFILLVCLTLIGSKMDAQNQPQIIIYNTSTCPLPNNTISDIKIDHLGNKWFSSYGGGLTKYDGSNWTVYTTSNSSIPSNQVSCIDEDAQGNIWIGTRNAQFSSSQGEGWGIAKFDGTTFTTYNTSNSGILDNVVNCIKCSQGNVFVGIGYNSSLYGLSKFNGTTWSNYQSPLQGILSIDVDQNGDPWLRDVNGFYKFANGNISNLYSLGSNLNSLGTLKIDANNNVWASGVNNQGGVFVRYNNSTNTWENRDSNITVHSPFNTGEYYPVWDIETDSHNNVWFAQWEDNTGYSQLFKFDGSQWFDYSYMLVQTIAIENNGNIWLGNADQGLRLVENCAPISSQPQDQNATVGGNAAFTIGVSGQNNTFQWQVDKNAGMGFENIADGTIYSGSTTASLTISNIQSYITDYKFRCKVDSGSLCNQITNTVKITTGATPINNVNANVGIQLYPNPTTNILNINSSIKINKVEVLNLVGDRLNAKYSNGKLNLSSLPNGIYFIRINSEFIYKVVKE